MTKSECEFMTVSLPSSPVIYILPKIHKSLKNPSGIVSAAGSLTENISCFVDYKTGLNGHE